MFDLLLGWLCDFSFPNSSTILPFFLGSHFGMVVFVCRLLFYVEKVELLELFIYIYILSIKTLIIYSIIASIFIAISIRFDNI
jgi:hypothetical protein